MKATQLNSLFLTHKVVLSKYREEVKEKNPICLFLLWQRLSSAIWWRPELLLAVLRSLFFIGLFDICLPLCLFCSSLTIFWELGTEGFGLSLYL